MAEMERHGFETAGNVETLENVFRSTSRTAEQETRQSRNLERFCSKFPKLLLTSSDKVERRNKLQKTKISQNSYGMHHRDTDVNTKIWNSPENSAGYTEIYYPDLRIFCDENIFEMSLEFRVLFKEIKQRKTFHHGLLLILLHVLTTTTPRK